MIECNGKKNEKPALFPSNDIKTQQNSLSEKQAF